MGNWKGTCLASVWTNKGDFRVVCSHVSSFYSSLICPSGEWRGLVSCQSCTKEMFTSEVPSITPSCISLAKGSLGNRSCILGCQSFTKKAVQLMYFLVSLSPAPAETSAKAKVASIFNLIAYNRHNIANNCLNIAHNHLNISCILKTGRADRVKIN